MKQYLPRNFMIGTGVSEAGGIASVLQTLQNSNLFKEWNIELIQTHTNKSVFFGINKALLFASALIKLAFNFIFRKVGFAHIHVASRGSFARKSIIVFLCKLFRVPIILHLHGAEFREYYHDECSRIKQSWIRKTFSYADQIIVLSTQWHSWITSIVPTTSKISIIYNSVPCLPDRQLKRIPFTVLFLGRLGQRKGVYDLLTISCTLAKEFPDYKLILGGDGDIDFCKKFVHENTLEKNVDIVGWISGDAKERLLSTSSIFILPSYNEGFPISILEAMSAGIPIIASTVGGIPDAIKSGEDGTLVAPGDLEALYTALKDAFTNNNKHQTYATKAKIKFDSNFSLPVITSKISAVYSSITSETK